MSHADVERGACTEILSRSTTLEKYVARPPVAAAAAMTPSNQQRMTQQYGARSQRQSLPSGWMELTDGVGGCCLESPMLLSQNN
jgi:hypothetical protein